ncbi:hypothetical protein [Actinoallomurus sp. CA-142502]|uniref:hypothetical protein n=1 Tax=Actinoallomurus sp. CA-142502 TaxID=3239885 RepID=UPI003D8D34F4
MSDASDKLAKAVDALCDEQGQVGACWGTDQFGRAFFDGQDGATGYHEVRDRVLTELETMVNLVRATGEKLIIAGRTYRVAEEASTVGSALPAHAADKGVAAQDPYHLPSLANTLPVSDPPPSGLTWAIALLERVFEMAIGGCEYPDGNVGDLARLRTAWQDAANSIIEVANDVNGHSRTVTMHNAGDTAKNYASFAAALAGAGDEGGLIWLAVVCGSIANAVDFLIRQKNAGRDQFIRSAEFVAATVIAGLFLSSILGPEAEGAAMAAVEAEAQSLRAVLLYLAKSVGTGMWFGGGLDLIAQGTRMEYGLQDGFNVGEFVNGTVAGGVAGGTLGWIARGDNPFTAKLAGWMSADGPKGFGARLSINWTAGTGVMAGSEAIANDGHVDLGRDLEAGLGMALLGSFSHGGDSGPRLPKVELSDGGVPEPTHGRTPPADSGGGLPLSDTGVGKDIDVQPVNHGSQPGAATGPETSTDPGTATGATEPQTTPSAGPTPEPQTTPSAGPTPEPQTTLSAGPTPEPQTTLSAGPAPDHGPAAPHSDPTVSTADQPRHVTGEPQVQPPAAGPPAGEGVGPAPRGPDAGAGPSNRIANILNPSAAGDTRAPRPNVSSAEPQARVADVPGTGGQSSVVGSGRPTEPRQPAPQERPVAPDDRASGAAPTTGGGQAPPAAVGDAILDQPRPVGEATRHEPAHQRRDGVSDPSHPGTDGASPLHAPLSDAGAPADGSGAAAEQGAAALRSESGQIDPQALRDWVDTLPRLPDITPDLHMTPDGALSTAAGPGGVYDAVHDTVRDFGARSVGLPADQIQPHRLGGDGPQGASGAPVIFIDHVPEPGVRERVAVTKIFPDLDEFAKELSGLHGLRDGRFTKFDVPETLSVGIARLSDGSEVGIGTFSLARGDSLTNLIQAVRDAPPGDRAAAFATAHEGVGEIAGALAELYRLTLRPERSPSPAYLQWYLDTLRGQADLMLQHPEVFEARRIDVEGLHASVRQSIAQLENDPGAASALHNDTNPGNLFYDPATKRVTLIDVSRAHESVDAAGEGIGAPAHDLGELKASLEVFSRILDLPRAESHALWQHFEQSFALAGGPGIPPGAVRAFETCSALLFAGLNRPLPAGLPREVAEAQQAAAVDILRELGAQGG